MSDPLRYEHCLYATALVAAEGTRYVVTVDLPRSYDPSHLNALLAMEALLQLDPTPAAVEARRDAFQRLKSPPAVRFTGPVADEYAFGIMLSAEWYGRPDRQARGRSIFNAVSFGEAPDPPLVPPNDAELDAFGAFVDDQQRRSAALTAALGFSAATVDYDRDPRDPREPSFPAVLHARPEVDPSALVAVARKALARFSFGPLEAVDDEEWPRLRTTLTAELRS